MTKSTILVQNLTFFSFKSIIANAHNFLISAKVIKGKKKNVSAKKKKTGKEEDKKKEEQPTAVLENKEEKKEEVFAEKTS